MTQTTTQHFIVIGNPIAHSKSPKIHQAFAKQAKLDIRYHRQYCPDHPESFHAVVEAFFNGGGTGANVTVPFKQEAYTLCAKDGDLSEHAKVAGAVNTLLLKDGKLYGDNTDGQGLVNHLLQLDWPLQEAKIAILGAGGASRGVILPLIEAGVAHITIANRTLSKAEAMLDELCSASNIIAKSQPQSCALEALTGRFDIIINATSIGLSTQTLPLDETLSCDYAYDMMYGRDLPFLTHFQQQGAQVAEGYGMLIGQAALSFQRWTGVAVDTHLLL
ncbi:shikimate dehydrogenase [Psychrobacter lutiphocae]|uniref:shikimate dehydrogenase n=1 Tax=Psychrobacter lutiphocae TaxID=540500 RepID=UPI000362F460|nr:shikimate dehydrogenase [Psychrobacter lutiphocae]